MKKVTTPELQAKMIVATNYLERAEKELKEEKPDLVAIQIMIKNALEQTKGDK